MLAAIFVAVMNFSPVVGESLRAQRSIAHKWEPGTVQDLSIQFRDYGDLY